MPSADSSSKLYPSNIAVYTVKCNIFHNIEQLLKHLRTFVLKNACRAVVTAEVFERSLQVDWPDVAA